MAPINETTLGMHQGDKVRVLSWYNDLSFFKMACTEQAPWGKPLWHTDEGPDAMGPHMIRRLWSKHFVLPLSEERPGCRSRYKWEKLAVLREDVLREHARENTRNMKWKQERTSVRASGRSPRPRQRPALRGL